METQPKAIHVLKEEGIAGFMKRWKAGIDKVTPLQQVNSQINSSYIMLIGILCGLAVAIYKWKSFWWGAIILIGALFNTAVQMIGLMQKRNALQRIEDLLKGGNENV